MDVLPDFEKFAELLLLAATRLLDDPSGGATKLNRVLYLAEFACVRSEGRPITGIAYQKLRNGPAPRRLLAIRDDLVASGAAVVEVAEFLGFRIDRLVPLREPDIGRFSATELHHIDDAVAAVRGRTPQEISDLSHRDTAWCMVELGDDIPFAAAYLDADQHTLTPGMRKRAAQIAATIHGVSA